MHNILVLLFGDCPLLQRPIILKLQASKSNVPLDQNFVEVSCPIVICR